MKGSIDLKSDADPGGLPTGKQRHWLTELGREEGDGMGLVRQCVGAPIMDQNPTVEVAV